MKKIEEKIANKKELKISIQWRIIKKKINESRRKIEKNKKEKSDKKNKNESNKKSFMIFFFF